MSSSKPEKATDRLNKLSVLQQLAFVFDVVARHPATDLVTEALEFLYLILQPRLEFLFLRRKTSSCLNCTGS
jgi:hypothetical protein